MNLSIMVNFQKRAFRLRVSEKVPKGNFTRTTKSERLSWECPKKQDKPKIGKKIKSRWCIAKNRKWTLSQILQKIKKWRIYITGYQICKIKIRWKNAERIDLRYLPRRSAVSEVPRGAVQAFFFIENCYVLITFAIKISQLTSRVRSGPGMVWVVNCFEEGK